MSRYHLSYLAYPFLFLLSCFFSVLIVFDSARADSEQEFLNTLKSTSQFTVAVLPMENMTVEGDVAYYLRLRLCEQLQVKGYSVVDNTLIDKKLYEHGVSHAGQLRLLSFDELTKFIPADGYLSGIVEQAAIQHGGIYNSFVYTGSLKLQDRTGKVWWSALQDRIAKRRFALDPVNMLVDVALTEGAVDTELAISALADRMLEKLPNGPSTVLVEESLLDMAVEVKVREK